MEEVFKRAMDLRKGDQFEYRGPTGVEKLTVVTTFRGVVWWYIGVESRPNLIIFQDGQEPVRVLYRPWSKGKTEAQMQDAVLEATQAFLNASESAKDEKLRMLREAIEAYELGKPMNDGERGGK